ncbi:hypothetical protein L2E82_13703 [Cichorium intybus]|uniref:Uncharacterized protein n=1 Tax=Cichorium intybus TaxID=13427 RepID=A0ACB9EXN3_CICIN|nr:hypothetical protein L2E82_13703 [Cichorium intybus]
MGELPALLGNLKGDIVTEIDTRVAAAIASIPPAPVAPPPPADRPLGAVVPGGGRYGEDEDEPLRVHAEDGHQRVCERG